MTTTLEILARALAEQGATALLIGGQALQAYGVNRQTMDGMLEQSRSFRIGALEFQVPSLLHLVALKLHAISNDPGREPRDLADVADLIRINRDSLDPDALRGICERHGPEELATRVMGYLR